MDLREELQEKFYDKMDKELADLKAELMTCKPEVIIERAYELVSKEELKSSIICRNCDTQELKALLKTDNLLQELYDEWMDLDAGFHQVLEDAVDETVERITEDFAKEKSKKSRESR